MDASPGLIDLNDEPNKDTKRFAKVSAMVVGVSAAFFVILAQDDFAPAYFDLIGKALFWTGGVLVPLLNFNRDVLSFPSGIIVALGLFALHAFFVVSLFGRLELFNFFMLTPLCLVQCLIFFTPLMLIRKLHCGIWY